MWKNIALLFSCIFFCLAGLLATNKQRLKRTFINEWAQDYELISKSGKMPKLWFDLKTVVVAPESLPLYSPSSDKENPVKNTVEGTHKVEILIVDATDGNAIAAIVQYHITNAERNTVWEFGRTLKLGHYYGALFWPNNTLNQF